MYYIGVDLGGTNIAAGIVNEKGDIVYQESVPTGAGKSAAIAERIVILVNKLLAHEGMTAEEVEAIGIGVPGTANQETGLVEYANNLGMEEEPFLQMLKPHFPGIRLAFENDANAANTFLGKVESVTAQFGPPEDEDGYITYTDPAPHGYCPEAAMVSFIDLLGRDNRAQGTWTITMKNGDVIRLHQTLEVHLIRTLDYYPEDYAMETAGELQTLIDEIGETADPSAVVNIHLPAVTYEGELTIGKRPVNLLGNTEGEERTVFTGTLRITTGANGRINEISDIDFVGSGRENVGITAAARVHLTGCTFTGWKTAVLAHGNSWLNFRYCEFQDNTVGFHFNASQSTVSHSQFTGNHFTENDTAILWEGTPVDIAISFHESVFAHNGTDIDNRSGQSIDISQAVFE